jgi:hypothetical protein
MRQTATSYGKTLICLVLPRTTRLGRCYQYRAAPAHPATTSAFSRRLLVVAPVRNPNANGFDALPRFTRGEASERSGEHDTFVWLTLDEARR